MKTKAQISFPVTAKLISAFVFATRTIHLILYLYPKFQDSSFLLCLFRPVCVGPDQKSRRLVFLHRGSYTNDRFSHDVAIAIPDIKCCKDKNIAKVSKVHIPPAVAIRGHTSLRQKADYRKRYTSSHQINT